MQLGGSGDISGAGFSQSLPLTKDMNDVWEINVGPLKPGAYRYNFNVEFVSVINLRNPAASESKENTWSVAYVQGFDWMEIKDMPHGAVSEVTNWSLTLNRFRRLPLYTPPGYEAGDGRFPVFYLLHGAFDSGDSWSTVGRAGFILDNFIAVGKAKPMVVVMPHGHTGPFRFGSGFTDRFEREFMADIITQMEKRCRIYPNRVNRAMAGLSMGGMQTLNNGIPNLEKSAYLGIYSSGIFDISGGPVGNQQGPSVEAKQKAYLDDTKLKEGLKLFGFATGKDEFLVRPSRVTV